MPWCPKCKDEYREGITVCADCGCELVDDLSLVCEEKTEEIDDQVVQMVQDPDPQKLLKLAEEFKLELEAQEEKPSFAPSKIYVNNEEKAEENKSSAYTLIPIGLIGVIVIILIFTGVISVPLSKFGKYMICGVMGSLFILFFIMGIFSLKNFKKFERKAKKENNMTERIKEWCLENFTKETVDANFDFEDTTEELKYFERINYVTEKINNQFMNLDESYLNRLVEEIYPEIFEK